MDEVSSSRGDAGVLAHITHRLDTLDLDRRDDLTHVVDEVRQLLGADVACIYGLAEGEVGWDLTRFHASGMPARFPRMFAGFLASAPRRWGVYDAGRPEPAQRNRVIEATRMVGPAVAHVQQRVFAPVGLGEHAHLRALVCEGASLLGWFGVLSTAPFTARQRGLLRTLVAPVRARLLAERRLDRARLGATALDVLLEEIPSPAMIVDAHAKVCESNGAGRALLGRSAAEVRAALTDALANRASSLPVRLTRLHGHALPDFWLAVFPVDAARQRVELATRRFRLTPREAEVLTWIARGATNQRIAAELGCSERTVELHVTHILNKADVDSRTALVATLLTT